MDTADEAMAYDAMDHRQVNRQFVDDLLSAGPVSGELLDLGTGTALIPIELCQRVDQVNVVAVDMSENMLQLARNHLESAGLTERIMVSLQDAKQLPYPDGRFAGVISNSIVHHIASPLDALREAVRVVAVGGRLFVRDLMRPPSRAQAKAFVEMYAANEDEHARTLFFDSLCAALTLEEMRDLVAQLDFDPLSVQATSDRHWTWSATRA